MSAKTREFLDKLECPCGKTNCEELFLHPACHQDSDPGTTAVYDQQNGVLTLKCHQCGRVVAQIQVAD